MNIVADLRLHQLRAVDRRARLQTVSLLPPLVDLEETMTSRGHANNAYNDIAEGD